MKTLIIRTDKLGDLYLTLPYINSIIKTYKKENIDLLVAENLYNHFKNKKYLYNQIFAYPKNGFLKKFLLLLNLRSKKYQNIIAFDGKDKSIILCILLRSIKKFIITEQRKLNFILNTIFINKNKYKIIINNKIESYETLFTRLLDLLNIKVNMNDYKYLQYENLKHLNLTKSVENDLLDFTMLHFDEKWFSKLYIKDFIDINPLKNDFLNFVKEFIIKKEKTLVVTTGIVDIDIITSICKNDCIKINDHLFEFKHHNYRALFFLKTNVKDLEILTMNSKTLITCQGPLTHVALSFNINVIDIIEKKLESWYNRHIFNKKNYNKLFRKDFKDLKNDILLNIK